MLDKKNFLKNLSITQGRHLKIIKKNIQLFPLKQWKEELKMFKETNLNFIEWVVSKESYKNNPICIKNGYKIILKNLKKNRIKCRSIDLDFIVKEAPLNFSNLKLKYLKKRIIRIVKNCDKIGIKYLIFPFLENSRPKNNQEFEKLVILFNSLKKIVSKNIILLLETDLNPKKIIKFIKNTNKEIFINYDIGNSSANNFKFEDEKKYFKYVKNIHLKDRVKFGKTVRFGKGSANFKKMFSFISKNKNKYDFNLQPARSNCNKDIMEIRSNLNYIQNIIKKI